ncbi:MAG: hypothetical protein KC417_15120, partial [Myxococcales bacterium]|nr:hypothetical protein [Myxococcales bacterium]
IVNEGSITLCIDTCDPLLQACGEGLGCFWTNNDFNCVFTAGDIAEAQPCGYVNDCAPGLVCTGTGIRTCKRVCSIGSDDVPCPGDSQHCIAYAYSPAGTGVCTPK